LASAEAPAAAWPQKKIGRLSRQGMDRVDEAINISLGLIEF
jgi:hypothetical protein